MSRAIEAIVKAYVQVEDISALEKMRAHRLGLLARSVDRDSYSFAAIRTDINEDIAVIDAGLEKLRQTGEGASIDTSGDD